MAVTVEKINTYYQMTSKKLTGYAGGQDNGETEEDIEQGEVD